MRRQKEDDEKQQDKQSVNPSISGPIAESLFLFCVPLSFLDHRIKQASLHSQVLERSILAVMVLKT